MAVRFTATGQAYTSTTAPPDDPFTITCLVKRVNDRNAISGIWGVQGTVGVSVATTSDGTTVQAIGSGGTPVLGAIATTANVWYRFGFAMNGTMDIVHGPLGGPLTLVTASSANITGPSTLRIGSSVISTDWFDGLEANFKIFDTNLSPDAMERELSQYVPYRTANLIRWHPMLDAATAAIDFSGNGRHLSGGAGATTAEGPPIPWSGRQRSQIHLAPDPTSTIWYAVYIVSTGELFSVGQTVELQAGMAYKIYIGAQPNLVTHEWDPVVLDFVLRAGYDLIDRVADLLGEAGMAAVWADLTAPNSTTLQTRLATLLGQHRYRDPVEPVDL